MYQTNFLPGNRLIQWYICKNEIDSVGYFWLNNQNSLLKFLFYNLKKLLNNLLVLFLMQPCTLLLIANKLIDAAIICFCNFISFYEHVIDWLLFWLHILFTKLSFQRKLAKY
jgi:hypothetical protein